MDDSNNSEMNKADLILRDTSEIKTCVKGMQRDFKDVISKLIYAMMGIVAATLGVKFLGTPFVVHLTAYVSILASVFLFLATLKDRKVLPKLQMAIRFLFAGLALHSGYIKALIFQPSIEPAPAWFPVSTDLFLVALSVLFIWQTWRPSKL